MQTKSEKGDLGKVLSCIRTALCNESIADMADTLGISPTYLNSIECNIRPCTFKILESIFINYVELKEIKDLSMEIFSAQNVFNSAWNSGLYSTLGIPLTPAQVFKVLQTRKLKKKSATEKEKSLWLQKIYDNPSEFSQLPAKYFLDNQFVEDVQQAVRFALMQKTNNTNDVDKDIQNEINEVFNAVSKKTQKSISKCGQCIENMKKTASGLSPVKAINKKTNNN